MRKHIAIVPLTLILFALAGCVPYPIYKTLQPSAVVTVRDSHSRPLEGAEVTLISEARPSFPKEKSRETKKTDAQGLAQFESRNEWRVEILALHGREEYSWHWCIQKPGFVTYKSEYKPELPSSDSTFILSEGESTSCTGYEWIDK